MKYLFVVIVFFNLVSCYYPKQELIEVNLINNKANKENILPKDTITPSGISLGLVESDTVLYLEAKKGQVTARISGPFLLSLYLKNPKIDYSIVWSNDNVLILHRGYGSPAFWESKIILFTTQNAKIFNCGEIVDINENGKYAVVCGENELYPLFIIDLKENEILDTLYFTGFEKGIAHIDMKPHFTHNFSSISSQSYFKIFEFKKDTLFFNFANNDTFLLFKNK